MGYTHYFERLIIFDISKFRDVARDIDTIIRKIHESGITICGFNGTGVPEINTDIIAFNGCDADDGACGSFNLDRKISTPHDITKHPNKMMDYCKTRSKPYDIAVCASLIIAKHYFGDDIRISSDGEIGNWQPAMRLVHDTHGYGDDFALDDLSDC